MTSAQRSSAVPDLPTIAEAAPLPGFDASSWFGLLAPAGTPPEIVIRLNGALRQALNSPDVREKFRAQAFESFITSPEEAGKFIAGEVGRFSRLIKTRGITAN